MKKQSKNKPEKISDVDLLIYAITAHTVALEMATDYIAHQNQTNDSNTLLKSYMISANNYLASLTPKQLEELLNRIRSLLLSKTVLMSISEQNNN